MGGFLGAAAAGIIYLEKHRVNIFEYADVSVFGLPLGEAIGRLGCFLIHDHPGTPTDFFLGVRYPDGVVRHDHGLYLSLNGLVLFLVFLWLLKRKVHPGTFVIIFLVWNGIARFILDFWRADQGAIIDARYWGMTPAQYASVVMVGVGIYLWRHKFFERGRQAWREFKWL
jgi:phosphatidylglycerol:prolipoprotein diacylglycerol transferase